MATPDSPPDTAWRLVGASVAGTSHVQSGQPCHDAFQSQILPGGELVVVVSDGAGSAPKAEVASALSVETALTAFQTAWQTKAPRCDADWHPLLTEVFQAVRVALEQQVTETDLTLRDYAATLLVLISTQVITIAARLRKNINNADDTVYATI